MNNLMKCNYDNTPVKKEIIDSEFGRTTIHSKEVLDGCYVFFGIHIDKEIVHNFAKEAAYALVECLGMSQKDAADVTGTSQSSVSREKKRRRKK